MVANQVTLLFGYIPPPKRKKPEAKPLDEGEEGEEGEEGAEKTEEQEPAEPEPEPESTPRSILLNSNVPCAIILHAARKAFIKEQPHALEHVTMQTPWHSLDFASEEGAVVGLGNEEALNEVACEKGLAERATYVLVQKVVDEEGAATYKYLGEPPSRFKETAFTGP